MKPSEALDIHRVALRALVARYGFLSVRVFGSVVAGLDDADSDLDLVIEPGDSTTLFTLAGFQIEAEKMLGVKVDVLTPQSLPVKFRTSVLEQSEQL
jgi:predicted nucleotidyltransferase